MESSSKLPVFLIPTITENLKQGGSIKYATLVITAWCYYSDKGVSKDGEKLEIVDEMKEALHQAAAGTSENKLLFPKLKPVFGDLVNSKSFTDEYSRMVGMFYENLDIAQQMQALLK
ncbi:MAG: hypothetical protein M0R33_23065 [Methylomonas sp.]|nr:hypothetical protein [Methylomonas sp.]